MNENLKLLELPKVETTQPELKTPHSAEVEDEVIKRLINEVVVPPQVELKLPKE